MDKWTRIDRGKGTPPGGAAFANIQSLARLAMALQRAYDQRQSDLAPRLERVRERLELQHGEMWVGHVPNDVALEADVVRDIAFDLANASLYDPRNSDVLSNLAVLFDYAGDAKRSELARTLAQKYTRVD